MQISGVQNQPNFQANFGKDAVTQNVLYRIRRCAMETNSHQMTDSAFNILGAVRKNQTLVLSVADGNKIIAKPKNLLKDIFGRNEIFEQEILNGDFADAFVRLTSKISRLW